MAVRQAGQHAAQLLQNEVGKQHFDGTVAPCGHDFARHARRISDTRKQDVGVEHHPQSGHSSSTRLGGCARLRPFKCDGGFDFGQPFRLGHIRIAGLYALA